MLAPHCCSGNGEILISRQAKRLAVMICDRLRLFAYFIYRDFDEFEARFPTTAQLFLAG